MFLGEWRFFCFLTFIVQFSNSQNDTTYVSFQSITQNVTISTPYHITDTAPNITEVNANHAGTKETSKITYEASTLQPTLQNSIDALTEKQTHLTHAWTEKQTHPTVVPQTLIMAQTSAKYPATNTPPTGSGKILTALYTRTYLNDITSERSSTNRKKQSTTQFTQTSTDKEVDQSTKIPVSKSIDDSVTSPKRVVTTCAKPDGRANDSEQFSETALVLSISLALTLTILFVCCICLVKRRRRRRNQTFTLPRSGPTKDSLEQGVDLRYIYTNGRNSSPSLDGQYRFYSVDLNDGDDFDDSVFKTKESDVKNRRVYTPNEPAVSTFLIGRTDQHPTDQSNTNRLTESDTPCGNLPTGKQIYEH